MFSMSAAISASLSAETLVGDSATAMRESAGRTAGVAAPCHVMEKHRDPDRRAADA